MLTVKETGVLLGAAGAAVGALGGFGYALLSYAPLHKTAFKASLIAGAACSLMISLTVWEEISKSDSPSYKVMTNGGFFIPLLCSTLSFVLAIGQLAVKIILDNTFPQPNISIILRRNIVIFSALTLTFAAGIPLVLVTLRIAHLKYC